MLYLANAFSTNMLHGDCSLSFIQVCREVGGAIIAIADEFTPALGHKDTAEVVKRDLGLDASLSLFNRITIELKRGDRLLVAQYTGPRLEVGATELPEGAVIKYWAVAFA